MEIKINTECIARIILPMLETITWEDWQHMDDGTTNVLANGRRAEVSAFARMASMMLSDIPYDSKDSQDSRVRIVWDSDNGLPVGVRILGTLHKYDFDALRNRYCDSHPGAERPLPPSEQQEGPLDLSDLCMQMWPGMYTDEE